MPRSLYANPKHGCSCTRLHMDTSPTCMCQPLLYMQVCGAPHVSAPFTHPCEAPRTGRCRGMVLLERPEGAACACLGQRKMYLGSRVRGWQFPWPPARSHAEGAAWLRGRTGRQRGCHVHGRRSEWELPLSQLCAVTWCVARRALSLLAPVPGSLSCLMLLLLGVAPASPAPRFHTSLLGGDPEHHWLGAEG